MGSICCVAFKGNSHRTIRNVASDNPHSNNCYSPSLSFRCDNHGRVVGEETSIHRFSDGMSCRDRSKIKYNAEYASGEESSMESTLNGWIKSPSSEGSAQSLRTHAPARSISKYISADPSLAQVKEQDKSSRDLHPSPSKLSHSLPTASSFSSSPQNVSKASRWARHSPNSAPQFLDQAYDNQSSGFIGDSDAGLTAGWSMEGLSELIASSERGNWPFESESSRFKTCGVCSKLLTEKPPWMFKNIVNDVSVVAVLPCRHVYHAECLENLTPESGNYEPSCPVCNVGEKQGLKLKGKALKSSNSSLRSPSSRKNFLFGSNRAFSMSNNQTSKKGFFRIKSTKS